MFCEFKFGHLGSGIWLLFCTSMKNVTIFQLLYFIREKRPILILFYMLMIYGLLVYNCLFRIELLDYF